MDVLRLAEWAQYPWLRHGFSTRDGGVSSVFGGEDLNLGFMREDEAAAVLENRRRFNLAVSDGVGMRLVGVRQVHGSEIVEVDEATDGEVLKDADGLVTETAGWLLGVQSADCVPILLADTRLRVVAAVHAGWRGTVAEIAVRAMERMRERFGSEAGDLVGVIGPAIGVCCYEVGDEVRDRFAGLFGDVEGIFEGRRLNLAEANRRLMVGAGMRAEAVSVLQECTSCARNADGSRRFFSHRAEAGRTGRSMGAIGIVAK